MENKIKFGVMLSFKDVFTEQPKPLNEYLSGIGQGVLLNIAALFLGFSNVNSKQKHYKTLIYDVFSQGNSEIANYIYQKIFEFENQQKGKPVIVINHKSSLTLFQYCFDNIGKEVTQTKEQAELNVFKAYLLVNQETTEAEMKAFSSSKDVELGLKIAAPFLAQSYPYSNLINYEDRQILTTQIVKAVFLFELLESYPETKHIYKRFLEFYKCEDWKEYFRRIVPVAFSVVTREKQAHTDLIITEDEKFEENCDFINRLIVNTDDNELLTSFDFYKIRSKPIYELEKGRYRIIFGLFMLEKIFTQLFFQLSYIDKELPKELRNKDFKSFYGKEFCEQVLLYRTMRSIYGNRYRKFTGLEIQEKYKKFDAEPDYYVRNGNKIFLFESKDISIKPEVKSSYDYQQYNEVFTERFYYAKKDDKISNKAILQLINNIRRILKRELPFDSNYNPNNVSIYPVIVVFDHQFNLGGLNVWINHWFSKELAKLKDIGLNVERVRKVVLMDIDALIYYQQSLSTKVVNLEEIFDSYFEYVKIDKSKTFMSIDEMNNYLLKSVSPFSVFIDNYIKRKTDGYIKPPQILDESLYSLLPEGDF